MREAAERCRHKYSQSGARHALDEQQAKQESQGDPQIMDRRVTPGVHAKYLGK
jgi:hypothetical protein